MISKETAELIWNCYREIEAAEKLVADIQKISEANDSRDKNSPTLRDAFGRRQYLQIGIPIGGSGHRLYDVHPSLAESVILSHAAHKRGELAELQERARIELEAK